MIFKNDELNLIYINRIIQRFLNKEKDKFKDTLDNLSLNDKIYTYKDFSFIYGHSDIFGYYFVAINKEKEGFMWIKPKQFEQNENGLFYASKNFKYLENHFYNVFNLENFRNIYINYIRTNELNKDIQTFLSIVLFRSFPWFKRFNSKISSKIIGVYIFNIIYNFSNSVNDLNKEIEKFNIEINNFQNNRIINSSMIKAATFTAMNIDKIMKKEISFADILDFDYS